MEQGRWGGTSQTAAPPVAPASSRRGRRRNQGRAARPHQHGSPAGGSTTSREQLKARTLPQFPLSDKTRDGGETMEQGRSGDTAQTAAPPTAAASSRPGGRRSHGCAARPHEHGPPAGGSAASREQLLARTIPQFPHSGDQLAIGKETGRLLGMGTNMYPSSAFLGQNKDEPIADLPVDDLIEKDDGLSAILSDGTIMTISKDRIKPSPLPDSWKLAEMFTTGMLLRGYLTIMTVIFFWAAYKTKKFLELTRFIVTIIILGVLFSAIRPVQAQPDISTWKVKFDKRGYAGWSDELYKLGTSRSWLEFTSTGQILLDYQTYPLAPRAWLHVNVTDETEWVNFIMRSDNYYLCAVQNREATHSFKEYAKFFPGSIDIGFAASYSGLNGERKNLTDIDLNEDNAKIALGILSRYKHGVSDPFTMKPSLTTYVLIMEGQRFTEVDECIRKGWKSNCHLDRPDVLLVNWEVLSCGILEGWEPQGHDSKWRWNRRRTYKEMLRKLDITREEAPGLLRVFLVGTACQDYIKGVRGINRPF